MRSLSNYQGQRLHSILLLTLLAAGLSACVPPQPVFLNASPCSSLIPSDWKDGVPSASLPSDHTAGAWVAFGDAQTGQLDKANSRTLDTIEIISTCEARDAAVQQSLTPKPWWRVW